jgi:hypothetical protein
MRHAYLAGFRRMFEVVVAAFGFDENPSIRLYFANYFF